MQTNAFSPGYATNSDTDDALIGDVAPDQGELLKTARGRLEDRLRQAFAERSRQVEKLANADL
jgi:hypothetical protein